MCNSAIAIKALDISVVLPQEHMYHKMQIILCKVDCSCIPPMLGPVRMMKGALPPPSCTSLGMKVLPALRCRPADGCLRPFAQNTCTAPIASHVDRKPASQHDDKLFWAALDCHK